jgi:hypothetical protein
MRTDGHEAFRNFANVPKNTSVIFFQKIKHCRKIEWICLWCKSSQSAVITATLKDV